MAIEFDVENLIGKVDAITATQLPYAGSRAMNQLGWQLKSEAWPVFAKQRFDRPVPFTESALRYKHEKGSLSLLVEFNTEAPKGQDPARYLFPTSTGSSIYITRFTKALRQKGIIPSSYVAIPNTRGRALAGEINQYGNVKTAPLGTEHARNTVTTGFSRCPTTGSRSVPGSTSSQVSIEQKAGLWMDCCSATRKTPRLCRESGILKNSQQQLRTNACRYC
jgi:hypothetical protein